MDVPYLIDIRKINGLGKQSRLKVTIEEITSMLPVSPAIRKGLIKLSKKFSEQSFCIIAMPANNTDHSFEGRGAYHRETFNGTDLTIYSKGVGSMDAMKENQKSVFGAYGPLYGRYLFDSADYGTVFPRTVGSIFVYTAAKEFLHALRLMVCIIKKYGLESIEDVIEAGVNIPLSVAVHEGLTKYVKKKAGSELTGRWEWDNARQLGSVSLVVPSECRVQRRMAILDSSKIMDIVNKAGVSCGFKIGHHFSLSGVIDAYKCVARATKQVYLFGGLYSEDSAHIQNAYFSEKSLCPQADNTDIIFPLELQSYERKMLLASRINSLIPPRMGFAVRAKEMKSIIRAMYGELIEDAKTAEQLAKAWFGYPQQISYEVAALVESKRSEGNIFEPPKELIDRVIDAKLYGDLYQKDLNRIEAELLEGSQYKYMKRSLNRPFSLEEAILSAKNLTDSDYVMDGTMAFISGQNPSSPIGIAEFF